MSDRDKAARGTKRTLTVAVVAISVGMIVMISSVVWAIDYRSSVTHRICMGQVAQNEVLRQILLVARDDALRRAENEAQTARVTKAYEPYLRLVPPLRCDESGKPQRVKTEEP